MAKRLFRACRDIRYRKGRVPPGTLVWLDKPEETIDRLLGFGVIAPVRTPPFEALPGWETRGPKIERAGVADIEDFLSRSPAELATLLEKSVRTIHRWRRDLEMWLTGQPPAA